MTLLLLLSYVRNRLGFEIKKSWIKTRQSADAVK